MLGSVSMHQEVLKAYCPLLQGETLTQLSISVCGMECFLHMANFEIHGTRYFQHREGTVSSSNHLQTSGKCVYVPEIEHLVGTAILAGLSTLELCCLWGGGVCGSGRQRIKQFDSNTSGCLLLHPHRRSFCWSV